MNVVSNGNGYGVGAPKTFSIYDEYGDSGLKRWGGFVQEEFLTELQGPRGIKIYKEIYENDAIVNAMLYAMKTLCRRAVWRVDAASSSYEDQFWAEFVRECMRDMSHTWESFIMEVLTEFEHGWAWMEKVFKVRGGDVQDPKFKSRYSDNRIGWRKLPLRAQETLYEWDLDDRGGIHGFSQVSFPRFEKLYIPIEKSLLFRTTTNKNNPEGRSLLRGAYSCWYKKKHIEIFEAIGIERDLVGIPYAEIPAQYLSADATDAERAVATGFKKLVTQMKKDEQAGFVMPQAWNDQGQPLFKVGLMRSGGEKLIDTDVVLKRYDQRIAQTLLADLILIGHIQVGSYALMDKKVSLFSRALDSFLDDIAEVLNLHAVPELVKINGGRPKVYPRLAHSAVEEVSLKDLGDFVNKLVGAHVIDPTPELESHLRDVARLPRKVESSQDAQMAQRTEELISDFQTAQTADQTVA